MLVAQCILFLVLLLAGPVWDHFEVPRLKADPARRTPFYVSGIVSQWIASLAALALCGTALWHAPIHSEWVARHAAPEFLIGFSVGLLAVMIVPFLGTLKPNGRTAIRKAFKKLEYLMPASSAQDAWFAVLCVTAGMCEEWLFRGFLLHFMLAGPWHTPLGLAIILSSGIFGLNHLYQGLSGMITAAILGALFAIMYIATGNLLLPMALHAVVDLRALGLLMASRERAGDAAA